VSGWDRHLDLGCGAAPRNPYGRSHLYGLDIVLPPGYRDSRFRQVNVWVDPIPFDDDFFDSVSAYDFLEHVPRVLSSGHGTRLPFVELMNEVWRVLRPAGRFYAITPAWPRPECFVDPTHVNVVTAGTHRYFTEPELGATVYGFRGRFRCVRTQWVRKRDAYVPPRPDAGQRLRGWLDVVMRRRAHLLWEFEAVK
jgi:SAM-dependent methyltransferase